ncbi:MAG: hypothetical protein J6S58_01590 [Lentisphaeria bacterium]|nr:hypothetical protein [Lentisphaeria bacterium]
MNGNIPVFLNHTHKVQPHECGPDGKVNLKGILDYFQDIASAHADLLNVGLEEMLRLRQIWVLSRLKVQIRKMPELGETLTVTTYPSGLNKLFATRQYSLCNEKGEFLCGASSFWLMVDKEKLRVVRPFKELAVYAELNKDKAIYFPEIDKIAERESNSGVVADYTVRHSHIYLNDHLNTAWYGSFIEDTLGELAGNRVGITEFQINFLQSCSLHTKVECKGVLADGTFYVEGRDSSNNQLCFQSEGTVR